MKDDIKKECKLLAISNQTKYTAEKSENTIKYIATDVKLLMMLTIP